MNDINLIQQEILSQDIDLNNDQFSDKVIAALVGDPKNNDAEGIYINEKRSSFIFLDVMDFDFKSMYPYIKIKNNIERTVQFFRVVIPNKISELENRRNKKLYWRGGEFVEDYSTKNFLLFANKWFGLKTIIDYINEFANELNEDEVPEDYSFKLKRVIGGNIVFRFKNDIKEKYDKK